MALGFGPELQKQQGITYIKQWLEDPREDYFSFDKEACVSLEYYHQMCEEISGPQKCPHANSAPKGLQKICLRRAPESRLIKSLLRFCRDIY